MIKRIESSVLAAVAAIALVLAAPMAASASELPAPDEGVVTTEVAPDPASVPVDDQIDEADPVDEPVVADDVVEEDVSSDSVTEDSDSESSVNNISSDDVVDDTPDATDDVVQEDATSVDGNVEDGSEESAWVPQSTLTLSAACAPEGGSTPLIFEYNFASGEGIIDIILNGYPLAAGGDTGGHVVPVGTHEYSYTVLNFAADQQAQQGPFSFTVEACDDPVVLVSPIAPTIDDIEYSIYIEDDPNFTFALESGQVLEPGDNVLGPIGPGVVIATPKDGVLVDPDATTQWPFEFSDDDDGGPQPPVFITPPAPTQIGNDAIIPSEEGVVYKDEEGNVVTDMVELTEDTCFTAEPSGDVPFAPLAQTRWCFTYTPPVVNPPQECPVFHVKNDKGECEPVDDTVIVPPGGDDDTTDQPGDGGTKQPDDKSDLPKSGVTGDELAQTGANLDVAGWLSATGLLLVSGVGLLLAARRRSA